MTSKRIVIAFLACLLFFAEAVALQWKGGAFRSEFGGHPDEAAQYMTGLMVRDYIASLRLASPMRYAEEYYIHYPKVAFGHWPPFFYILQAAWTLLFSPARASVLLLMALLTALLAGTVYLTIESEFGTTAGIASGLLLPALPLIQRYTAMVMSDILVALLTLWAVLYFGRYLETERWQDATGFGVVATLAILTKGNALALALVPPLAVLLSRRFRFFIRPSFWFPAVIVLVLCGPWYWLTLDMVRTGWQQNISTIEFALGAMRYYFRQLIGVTGIGLATLVAIGFVIRVAGPFLQGDAEGKWAVFASLLASVFVFQCMAPVGMEARYLITVVPALLMFLVAGVFWVAKRLPLARLSLEGKLSVSALAVVLVFAAETFEIPRKTYSGFGQVAQRLLSTQEFNKSVVLVSSDPRGEGMFISETAVREQRPGHILLRASKVLSRSEWSGAKYELLYRTREEIMKYLDGIPVGIVVVDLSDPDGGEFEHQRLLLQTLESYPQRWELIGSYPLVRLGKEYPGALRVYRLVGHEKKPVGKIRIDMSTTLKRTIEE